MGPMSFFFCCLFSLFCPFCPFCPFLSFYPCPLAERCGSSDGKFLLLFLFLLFHTSNLVYIVLYCTVLYCMERPGPAKLILLKSICVESLMGIPRVNAACSLVFFAAVHGSQLLLSLVRLTQADSRAAR